MPEQKSLLHVILRNVFEERAELLLLPRSENRLAATERKSGVRQRSRTRGNLKSIVRVSETKTASRGAAFLVYRIYSINILSGGQRRRAVVKRNILAQAEVHRLLQCHSAMPFLRDAASIRLSLPSRQCPLAGGRDVRLQPGALGLLLLSPVCAGLARPPRRPLTPDRDGTPRHGAFWSSSSVACFVWACLKLAMRSRTARSRSSLSSLPMGPGCEPPS